MGIFNHIKEINLPDSVSKVKFDIDLSDYVTIKQFKKLQRDLGEYLHKNKELDNKMNRALDMGGNEIINLGNPDKPNDAVSRRFFFRKIQSLISDYDLGDIKVIKQTLETEKNNIDELTKDIKANEKVIIELQGKIAKEMETLSEAMEALEKETDKTDDEIKQALKLNINLIASQIKELKENMIKHEELKEKINEAVNKLQNMYQLEIKTEIKKLNDDTAERNLELLNTFLSKFAEYKADLEKTASERGDKQNTELDALKKSFQTAIKNINDHHNEQYNDLFKLTAILQEEIAKCNTKIKEIEDKLDFAIEKSVKQGESIETINDKVDGNDKATTKRIDDMDKKVNLINSLLKDSDYVTTKRIDDLAEVILKLENKHNALEENVETVRREVFLFEYYNSRQQHVKVYKGRLYDIEDKQLQQKVIKSKNLFVMFGLRANKITDYKSFIKINHEDEGKDVFQVKEGGNYIIEINLIVDYYTKELSSFIFEWWSGPDNWSQTSGQEYINYDSKNTTRIYKKKIKIKLLRGMMFAIYLSFPTEFTIEPESYVRFYLVN